MVLSFQVSLIEVEEAEAATRLVGETGGYGFVNYVGGGTFVPPRPGTLEMRSLF